jgi:hypothetical protein
MSLLRFVIGALVLFILCLLFFPSVAWTGGAWLTIDIRLTDAVSKQPIPNATVILLPDPPAHVDERILSPTILTAQTDSKGRAVLKHLFGAGGGSFNTTIRVRNSVVRCERVGYVSADVRVAEAGRLPFRDLPFVRRQHTTKRFVALSRQ